MLLLQGIEGMERGTSDDGVVEAQSARVRDDANASSATVEGPHSQSNGDDNRIDNDMVKRSAKKGRMRLYGSACACALQSVQDHRAGRRPFVREKNQFAELNRRRVVRWGQRNPKVV